MICTKCNFQNEDTAKFCGNCGTELNVISASQSLTPLKQNSNTATWVMSILFVLALVAFIFTWSQKQVSPTSSQGEVEKTPRRVSSQVEPNEQKIKQDLAGRTIPEPTRTLHRKVFQVRAASNVQNVDILDKEKIANQILYRTRLKLNDDINTYMADVNITYVLDNKEWVIQHLESRYLDIVPTGKFDGCIVVKASGGFYNLYNNCDVILVVEGRHWGWFYSDRWSDFAYVVPANGHVNFIGTYAEYRIERIERP